MAGKTAADEAAELISSQAEIEAEARLATAEADVRQLQREKGALKRELGRALQLREEVADAARATPPPPRWKPPKSRRKKTFVEFEAFVGDLHVGEVVDAAQADGWGVFNYAIAEARMRRYAARALEYVAVQRHGYRIPNCRVWPLGDMISGDIHEELMRHNEFPPPVQAILAGRLIAGFVLSMAGQFESVTVEAVGASNHSRLSKRYQFKGGAFNSFDFVAYEYAKTLLARCGNVTFNNYIAKKKTITACGFKFVTAHGDQVRAWMGIPYYGIARERAREAERRLESLMEDLRTGEHKEEGFDPAGMDYMLGGHWHSPMVGPSGRYIINGSLTGSTELDNALGRHARPQQMTALLSPKHGLFSHIMWHLDSEEDLALAPKRWRMDE